MGIEKVGFGWVRVYPNCQKSGLGMSSIKKVESGGYFRVRVYSNPLLIFTYGSFFISDHIFTYGSVFLACGSYGIDGFRLFHNHYEFRTLLKAVQS